MLTIFYCVEPIGTKYACRGFGNEYDRFYNEWVPTSSYRCTSEDFPWDFFVFDTPNDHDLLVAAFPGCVFQQEV